ncbi:glycosyltransferase family 4 protein [Flavobacterium urocaniciphilum]|uniref:Glycosyltransferase involved in cell wall bisynthesis n=1 Tax=Flavobacterium urocaniciphilum TaxID=1299341 RepID=A0A1H8YRC1_9FLAO|nr:glycosyltransferase family 4 protein [Flavobacterium urocaniciphilum]SEP54764.1 Glycosyltransferase involved in cell wall bisynthesis [Flavobacterium urocaniciphilum]
MKIIVYHIGARDYYSIGEFFSKRNLLLCLITDYWKRSKSTFFTNKFSRRFNKNIQSNQIISYSILQIFFVEVCIKLMSNKFRIWNFTGNYFTNFALKKILNKIDSTEKILLWGYTGGNLKILKRLKKNQNVFFLHNQIDPGIVYYDIENGENSTYKEQFLKNIQEEWKLADAILVNSEFSKKCLEKYQVNADKIIVVPLIYNVTSNIKKKHFNPVLTIGFVGNINEMKGFPIFLDVAKQLKGICNFTAIGTSHFSENYIDNASEFIKFTGHMSMKNLSVAYQNMDVLVFPTQCDGFGMVQLEAMSYGIPVIASPNCATVVQENSNGFIEDDANSIVKRILYLNENREILKQFSENALLRINDYSEANFEKILSNELLKFNIEIK